MVQEELRMKLSISSLHEIDEYKQIVVYQLQLNGKIIRISSMKKKTNKPSGGTGSSMTFISDG
jgi:hypothetical protein